jgi:hypothetical protein
MKNKIVPFVLGIACVFAIAAGVARQPFYASGPTLVQTGTCVAVADGTVTNTFSPIYSSAPKVTATQTGTALNTSTNIVVSITPSNFVIRTGLASTTNNWIAVGTP